VLPHESDAQAEIAQRYRVQLDAMTKLHDTVVSMMTAGEWKVHTRCMRPSVCAASTSARSSDDYDNHLATARMSRRFDSQARTVSK
jgi:hypothetical protein